MDYIMQCTGMDKDGVINGLKGDIFYNPVRDTWEHKGKFIAGNVIEKCKEIVSCLPDLPPYGEGLGGNLCKGVGGSRARTDTIRRTGYQHGRALD